MKEVNYRNYEHYIAEGWHRDPKRIFVFLADYLAGLEDGSRKSLLDVGCSTGELIGYLKHRFPGTDLVGIDIFSPLIEEAVRLVPDACFLEMSGLDLPGDFAGRFDVVPAVGVIDVFDHDDSERFVRGMMACCKPGGRVLLLSPFNEYGMDLIARHRKWSVVGAGPWESGNNVYAEETIRQIAGPEVEMSFLPFDIGMDLPRRDDPQRTWTVNALGKHRQLMNGLKLLIDLSLCVIELPALGLRHD